MRSPAARLVVGLRRFGYECSLQVTGLFLLAQYRIYWDLIYTRRINNGDLRPYWKAEFSVCDSNLMRRNSLTLTVHYWRVIKMRNALLALVVGDTDDHTQTQIRRTPGGKIAGARPKLKSRVSHGTGFVCLYSK